MSQETALAKHDDRKNQVATELNEVFENILPWTLATENTAELLARHTENDAESIRAFLSSVYLFRITEVSVAEDRIEDAISRAIGKRHQALVTAAYQSGLTLVTLLIGERSGVVKLFMGVSGQEDAKEVFMRQLKGIYPGKGMALVQASENEHVILQALESKVHGGVVTGIPPVRLESERQFFDLSSVIRSMHGEPFVLMSVARPVAKDVAAQQILEIMRIKDTCHSLVKQTLMRSETSEVHQDLGEAIAKTVGGGGNSSVTKGGNVSGFGSVAGTSGVNLSGAISVTHGVTWPVAAYVTYTGTIGGMLAGTLTLGGSAGLSRAKTLGESTSESITTTGSETNGWSKSLGQSLQVEQQNSLAMELEHIADKLIKRLRIGLNSGIWEMYLTYATGSEVGSKVLSGAVCGELLKADPDALPSRNIASALPGNKTLFLPLCGNSGDMLMGNPLVSHVSSEEAALLLSPPLNSVPGFDIRLKPALSLTDVVHDQDAASIGEISEHGRAINGSAFSLSRNDIRKHVFVAGLTGSGKTTTVKEILVNADVPFLVIESAKREYRRFLADERMKRRVRVYTVGDSTIAPFRHNPFVILPGVSAITHIDNLKSIFNASFSLYGPMPYLLEQCLHSIYRKRGWNLTTGVHHVVNVHTISDCRQHSYIYPTIRDLITEVNRFVLEQTEYRGELRDNIRSAIVTRMESLAVGAKGFIFNTTECVDIGELLEKRVVFELESLADDDDKAFFVGLILALISEYRQIAARCGSRDNDENLKHILVIEEAHRLLKHMATERTSEMLGNPKGKAVETFCNIIAEMRSFGQGVIVAEQIPTKIAADVIKNTNTKIIHRLVSSDDQLAIGASLGIPEADRHYLNQLATGFALVHKEGMARPIEVCINNTTSNRPVGDDLIAERWRDPLEADPRGLQLSRQDLEMQLFLHESGLLDDSFVASTARRLLNSVMISNYEVGDLIPDALRSVRSCHRNEYLQDSTIIRALEHWFARVLLAPVLDLGCGKMPSPEVIEGISRLWNEPHEFNRERLIHRLDMWRGSSTVERLREFAAITVLKEVAGQPEEANLKELADRELLVVDHIASEAIRDTIRQRLL